MTIAGALALALLTVGLVSGCGDHPRKRSLTPGKGLFDRFLAQASTLDPAPRRALVDELMEMLESGKSGGIPYREDTVATFLYLGDEKDVRLAGDWNGWQPLDSLQHLEYTDLYYYQREFPSNARLEYKYVVNGVWILDPQNRAKAIGLYGPNSELVMPDYIPPASVLPHPELRQRGRISPFTFPTGKKGETRNIQVYLPFGYQPEDSLAYPTLYVQDGTDFINLAGMPEILDWSISTGRCRPLIVVFVDPVDRESEYWLDDKFIAMMCNKLVPMIDQRYKTLDEPGMRGMAGSSLGGATAVYAAHSRADVFGLAAGLSSALWINNQYAIDIIENDSTTSSRYYLDWGRFEVEDIRQTNARLASVLMEKGYNLRWTERPEGHSWHHWRSVIDEMLATLYPPESME